MTHSGGNPHTNVGDRGQRYEVTFYDTESRRRRVIGWATTPEHAQVMVEAVHLHPAWTDPQIQDRLSKKKEPRP